MDNLSKLIHQEAEVRFRKDKGYKRDIALLRKMQKREKKRMIEGWMDTFEELNKISEKKLPNGNKE